MSGAANSGGELRIASEGDIVAARKQVRESAKEIGFGITEITRIVTAASELARNIQRYAGQGSMAWQQLNHKGRTGLELVFRDNGPGIANIEQAMQEGFSTVKSLGMGLPGAKRLMDEMEIESAPGKGTVVVIRKWLGR